MDVKIVLNGVVSLGGGIKEEREMGEFEGDR